MQTYWNVSSTNNLGTLLIEFEILLIYIKKRRGPKVELWGIPKLLKVELVPTKFENCFLFKKDCNIKWAGPRTPKCSSLAISILWHTLSKSFFQIEKKYPREALFIYVIKSSRYDVHYCMSYWNVFFSNSYWCVSITLWLPKKITTLLYTNFSTIYKSSWE